MPCRRPIQGWRSKFANENGKFPVLFSIGKDCGEKLAIPCGKCVSCKLDKSREWGARIAHECQVLEQSGLYSTFLTLTYDEKHLPDNGSLVPEHMQKFVKKLREHAWRKFKRKVRYYYSGEYGSRCTKHEIHDCPVCGEIQRPHYHMICLGFDFPDRELVGDREGLCVYESELLHQLWPFGFHEIGSVSFESAAYVARYTMKKVDDPKRLDEGHYMRYCWMRDNWYEVEREFAHMSKNPGIGSDWFDKYAKDLYPSDELPVPGRGLMGKPPKYYDSKYELLDPEGMEEIKEERRKAMIEILEARARGESPSAESLAMNEDARIEKLGRSM